MVKCKYCEKPLDDSFVDETCDFCWEVTARLKDFLRRPAGRAFAEDLMRRLDNGG